ncbi:helix-turn-helix transcriptional regulator [Natrialbaceae archaeon GCM10025810]|uniref:helix-turn-helix transcriptional regulator n=1 Tax=Halovalidus salilacus TaxID=3075124 RepID=UPI00360D3B36
MTHQFRAHCLAPFTLQALVPVGHRLDLLPLRALQLEWSPHLAALLGILALGVLGGLLTIRNRLERENPGADERTVPHEEFMTDRERVCRLVEENGGRMKQSEIVDSVDWSKAKVSRLLADLEEDGDVTKLRLGRENLVCLSGHEPRASRSPEGPNRE